MPAIRSLFSLVFPKVFGTTQGKSAYANISSGAKTPSSTHKLASKSSMPAIRVKKEFTVRSRHKDEVSIVELSHMPFGSDPTTSRNSSEKKPTTPHESV